MPTGSYNKIAKDIQKDCGYMDEASIVKVYQGLLTYLVVRLRDEHRVILPDLGTFTLRKRKARRTHNVATGQLVEIPAQTSVSFRPTAKLKEFFHEFL